MELDHDDKQDVVLPGLSLSHTKSEYIAIGPDINMTVTDGTIPRAQDNHMKVLGVYLQTVGGSSDELDRRIANMWKALAARRLGLARAPARSTRGCSCWCWPVKSYKVLKLQSYKATKVASEGRSCWCW